MGFSRQDWNGLPCPPPEDLLNPGIRFRSFTLQVDPLPSEPPGNSKNNGVGSLSLLQGNLPDPGIELGSLALQANSLPAELPGKPIYVCMDIKLSKAALQKLHCKITSTSSYCLSF